ncbi:MAG: FHA domain-containing protein [Chloroflexi bacterium]|nr:FHA domain-containing protein [Chloroflexota bacterium]
MSDEFADARPARLRSQGTATRVEFVLEARTTLIGRSPQCDIQVDEPLASRRHAEIVRQTWRYVISDVGSRNGTLLNGEVLDGERQLRHGDVIQVGTTRLQFDDPNATIVEATGLPRANLSVWVNHQSGEAYAHGKALVLAPKELAFLTLLFEHPGVICDRNQVAIKVWPEYGGRIGSYNIETLVSRLRRKLEHAGASPDLIVTVRGRGYRLTNPDPSPATGEP